MPTTTSVQIRFGDLDVLGHVNNVAYYHLMESGRGQFFTEHPHDMFGRMVIARSECDYRAEIPGGTRTVDVTVSVEKVGTTSFTLLHELRLGDRLVAVGRTVHVVLGEQDRPRPLTAEEKQLLANA